MVMENQLETVHSDSLEMLEHTAIRNSILRMCLESQRLREKMMRMLRLMPPRNVI